MRIANRASSSLRPRMPVALPLIGVFMIVSPARSLGAEAVKQSANTIPADVPTVSAPSVDFAAVAIEDQARAAAGLAPRYAVVNQVAITPDDYGVWDDANRGMRVWRLRVTSPGALSLNLGFTTYFMPVGGRLVVRSADGVQAIRPFTAEDNAEHGELWTPPLVSDDIVVEVTVPADSVEQLQLALTSINVGYRAFGGSGPIESGACNIDVVCPEGDLWRDEIPSVGVISTGGGTFCTGFMVNNTAQDQTPYFMTADHCGINSGNAASLVVFWNYETSVCGGTPNGSLSTFQTGSFFRAGYTPSDFTLVELDSDPLLAWGITFAGWNRTGANASSAVAIHHPNTDEKRISFENQATSNTSYFGTSVPGDGTHVRVTDWDLGTTEPGSSGSPLFNQSHQVIGQLHGGGAACGNNQSDWYGRFSLSWTGGGTTSSRLSNWLDPGGTGATSVNTLLSSPPDPTGGCCVGLSCSIQTAANCSILGGAYQGNGTNCTSTGATTVYSASPNVSIPDDGGPVNPVTHTINVPDAITIADVNIDVTITHTFVGDIIVQVTHGGITRTIVDRPGYTGNAVDLSDAHSIRPSFDPLVYSPLGDPRL